MPIILQDILRSILIYLSNIEAIIQHYFQRHGRILTPTRQWST